LEKAAQKIQGQLHQAFLDLRTSNFLGDLANGSFVIEWFAILAIIDEPGVLGDSYSLTGSVAINFRLEISDLALFEENTLKLVPSLGVDVPFFSNICDRFEELLFHLKSVQFHEGRVGAQLPPIQRRSIETLRKVFDDLPVSFGLVSQLPPRSEVMQRETAVYHKSACPIELRVGKDCIPIHRSSPFFLLAHL
jgi:hypothetical protein